MRSSGYEAGLCGDAVSFLHPRHGATRARRPDRHRLPSLPLTFVSGGEVEEVPRSEAALLVLDEQQTFAGEHQEVLLRLLGVVEAVRLAGLEDGDSTPSSSNSRLAIELAVDPKSSLVDSRLRDVDDEPAGWRREPART